MNLTSKISLVLAVIFACTIMTGTAVFAENKSFKEAAVDAGRATVNYPANLVNETVNTVGTAAKNTAGVAVDTVKVTGETLSGDTNKAPEIVTTPVKESVETVKDATVDTVQTPMKAADKTKEQM